MVWDISDVCKRRMGVKIDWKAIFMSWPNFSNNDFKNYRSGSSVFKKVKCDELEHFAFFITN